MLYTFAPQQNLSAGYMQAGLNYIKALQTQNVDFILRPLGSGLAWGMMPEWIQSSSSYFVSTTMDESINLIHLQPAQLCEAPLNPKALNIGLTTFETTFIPAWIAKRLNTLYQGFIVPSAHNANALLDSGITIPIFVVEHAIGEWWWTAPPPSRLENEDTYIFGYVGAWNYRKNPEALVKAYLKAFPTPMEDAALFIKTAGDVGINSYFSYCLDGETRPDIWFYNEIWGESQIQWAHGLFDCYVSAHRGEGFGLGLAQAALLGKPVIYTDYSAPTEWLAGKEGHIPVSYTESNVVGMDASQTPHFQKASQDLKWADPDEDALVEAFRTAYAQRPKTSSTETTELRNRFSWEHIGSCLVDSIESLSPRSIRYSLPSGNESDATDPLLPPRALGGETVEGV